MSKNTPDPQLEALIRKANVLLATNNLSTTTTKRNTFYLNGGNDFGDTLHYVDIDYGYPNELVFKNFWNMYRRQGVAKRVIDLPVNYCWRSEPIIKTSAVALENIRQLDKRVKLWNRLQGLDRRQRVGRYAGLYVRVRDGQDPSTPLEPLTGGINGLVELMPLYESQLDVTQAVTDPRDEMYGQPVLLNYRENVAGSRNEEIASSITIHASRIIFAAEGADNGWIYGIPALEAVFNAILDLRKISGGGAEGFYKNASQTTVLSVKDGESALSNAAKLQEFANEYDEFMRSRMRRAMWTPGMDAKTMESNLITPEMFYQVCLQEVAAGTGIPANLLVGKQTGRLASDDDTKNFLMDMQSRRVNFCTDLVERTFKFFTTYNILPQFEYEIEWDDLLARSDDQKVDITTKMSEVNKNAFSSGQMPVFTEDEMREMAGYTKQDESSVAPTETDLDEEDLARDGE